MVNSKVWNICLSKSMMNKREKLWNHMNSFFVMFSLNNSKKNLLHWRKILINSLLNPSLNKCMFNCPAIILLKFAQKICYLCKFDKWWWCVMSFTNVLWSFNCLFCRNIAWLLWHIISLIFFDVQQTYIFYTFVKMPFEYIFICHNHYGLILTFFFIKKYKKNRKHPKYSVFQF